MKNHKNDIDINSAAEEKDVPKPPQAQKSRPSYLFRLFHSSPVPQSNQEKEEQEAEKESKTRREKTPSFQSEPDNKKIPSFPPRYQDQGQLGKGGVGFVYKALDTKLNRLVAFKVLQSCSGNKERFLKEAQAIANLNHPNIVKVYDFGESPCWFYTMELLEGRTLNDVQKTGQKGFRWVAEIFQKIAQALQYAHEKGIFHHDIKPSNIYLVNQDQEPKLLDFGLTIGTELYMPPENCYEKKFDGRSDLYSMGVTLYEVLTGIRPFPHDERAFKTCLYQPALSPKEMNPEIPDSLAMICLKCLEKDCDKRYASAGEMAEALQKYLSPDTVCQEGEEEGKITHFTAIKTDRLEGGSCNIDAQAEEIEDSELIQAKEIHQAEVKETIESKNLKNVTGLKAETIGTEAKIEIKIRANKVSGTLTGANFKQPGSK
ncbi:MAG: serine/threonine protein kinase [Candidatus Brocadiae bacterium]|nr:serine/threonine protein kinase [Candidatus Brocadiia bacterium]